MRMLERVLVAVDINRIAATAFKAAVRLAREFNSELIVLHVIPLTDRTQAVSDELRSQVTAHLEDMAKSVRRDISVEVEVAVGKPYDEILACANRRDVNVVFLGVDDYPGRDAAQMGITSERVIQRSTQPVWAVKSATLSIPGRILCPVDFSACSKRALSNAIHLARHFGAELTAFNAFPSFSALYGELGEKESLFEGESWHEHEMRFDAFLRGFDLSNVRWHRVICQGKPVEQILRMAHETECDLLVMGTRGLGAIRRIVMGSVTTRVLRHMPCSVLTMASHEVIRLQIESEIDDLDAACAEGRSLLQEGFAEEAVRQFQACVARNSVYAPAWEGLADAFDRTGKHKEAERSQQCALLIRRRLLPGGKRDAVDNPVSHQGSHQ